MPKYVYETNDLLNFIDSMVKTSKTDFFMFESIEKLLNMINPKDKETKVSKRTLYRRISELRRSNLIVESHVYFHKYKKVEKPFYENVIIVDDNGTIINDEIKETDNIIERIGEQKYIMFKITEEGKKILNKEKKKHG